MLTVTGNTIHHSGYKPSQLYIEKKYASIKQEIFEYKHLKINQYHKEILPKVKVYHNTDYAKSIKAKGNGYLDNIPPHYEIAGGSVISSSHIVAVILYTDYTRLSTDFSSSFRKIHPFDTLKNIKQRNRNYWWMSKLLRETVEIFGECSSVLSDNPLVGPFYSGISRVINISNYFLRLSGPTSSSIKVAVAIKFSGTDGLILKLNNPTDDYHCSKLRGFDCSFISQYKEEEERLGLHRW